MMNKRKAELLAPAGSFDSLKAAVAAGADAIYMGGSRFGARAYAQNAAGQEMVEAIRYAHLHGCRLYMTVNTLFKEKELEELRDYMKPYYEAGLDGVIVQDLGALQVMKQAFPGMELHASTQMTVTSVYSAKMLKEMGCCRVVPARELSLEEISRIYKETGMDIRSRCLVLLLFRPMPDEQSYWRPKRKQRPLCPAMPSALPGMGRRQGRGKKLKQGEPEVCIKFKRSLYSGYFAEYLRGWCLFLKDRRKDEEPQIYSRRSPYLQKISGYV